MKLRYLYLVLFLLFAFNLLAQTHTEVTIEDAQTITGAKTFNGNFNAFAGQNQIDAYYLNGAHVVEGIHYPFTNAGLQQAITDCVTDVGCNEVSIAAGATIHLTTCLSGFNNQIYIHSSSFGASKLVLDSDIDGFCPASQTQNLRIENLEIATNTGVVLTSNHAAIHLLNAPRPVIKNMLISTEATAGGCLLLENNGDAANVGFGMWEGGFENITCQRTTPNQGTPDTNLGHFGIYCKGQSTGTNPDCSMNTFTQIWIENHGVGMQFDFANSNTVTRAHLLFNSINFKCVSCKDNTIIARLNQFRSSGSPVSGTNEHYNFDAGSSDNNLFWKLESPSTKGTDSGTRNNLFLGATDAWNFSSLRSLNGSASSPSISFQAFNSYGLFMDSSNGFAFAHGGVEIETSCTPGVCLASSTQLAWNSAAFSGGATPDTGLKRLAAGVVAPTNGSSGVGAYGVTNMLISGAAPTIAGAGCGGSAASIPANNGTAAFTVNVGTAPTSGGCTITLPAATTDWVCQCTDRTTNSTGVFQCKQSNTAASTTSAVLTMYSDVAVATAPTASDILRVSCHAY